MQITIYNIIFLPVIILLGCITMFTDFKISKIENRWILASLFYVLTVYAVFWLLSVVSMHNKALFFPQKFFSNLFWNFDKWCWNLIISTCVAFFLFRNRIWGAGDAKLFIVYIALTPLAVYQRVYFDYYFASLFLLMTIFIPAMFFLAGRSIVFFGKKILFVKEDTSRKKILQDIGQKLFLFKKVDWKKMFEVSIGFFTFFLFFKLLRQYLDNFIESFLSSQNFIMCTALLIFRPLSNFFRKEFKIMLLFFFILLGRSLFINRNSFDQFLIQFFYIGKNTILLIIAWPFLESILNAYADATLMHKNPFAHWIFLGIIIVWFF